MVIHEHCRTGEPLSVEFAPNSLTPTGIRYGEMDAVFTQIVPVHSGHQMSEGIEVIVGNHLGVAAGSAGEVHQQHVIIGVDMFRLFELRNILPLSMEIMEPFGDFRSDAYESLHRRAFGHRVKHVIKDHLFAGADYRLYACPVGTVNYIVTGKKVSRGNGDRTYLAEAHHREPEFITPLQHDHHHVALAYPQSLEIRSSTI